MVNNLIEGYIIFAARHKDKGLLHTTIKPTKKECLAWARAKNLPEIIEVSPLSEFLKRNENGNTMK